MNILKRGHVLSEKSEATTYYMLCPTCKSKLKFFTEDVRVKRSELVNAYVSGIPVHLQTPGKKCTDTTYIKCAVCSCEITLDKTEKHFAGDDAVSPPSPSYRNLGLYLSKDALKRHISHDDEDDERWYKGDD